MNPQRISFARTLPVAALLLSFIIVAVPATMTYSGFRQLSRDGRGVTFHSRRYQFTIPPEHFLRSSIFGSAEITSHAIETLNAPGFIIEFGVDRFLPTGPKEWAPAKMSYALWRAIILPICCLPFWWFAGIGIDALTTRRRRSSWLLLLGSVLSIFFGVIATGLWFGNARPDRDGLGLVCVGLAFWLVLLAAFPITWVKQALAWRRIRTSLQTRLLAELQ